MDWNIALNAANHTLSDDGTRANSKPIYIPPGKVALLSMFNMVTTYDLVDKVLPDGVTHKVLTSNDCAIVVKLSVGKSQTIIDKFTKCETLDISSILQDMLDARKITQEPVYQGGEEWGISPCNNMVLIPTPGLYMVQILDPQQLDVAFIEYTLLDVADAVIIPDEFKLGYGSPSMCNS
jgi:hypothetical protein